MERAEKELQRIADLLSQLIPVSSAATDWHSDPAYVWDGSCGHPVAQIEAPALSLIKGVDQQKAAVAQNIQRLGCGFAAHDMLLWGARGMGKSALIRSAVANAQSRSDAAIALIQIGTDAVNSLPALFGALRTVDRNFLLFIDDLGFADDDAIGPRQIRSWLEGGIEARPANVRLAVTSNRRAIVPRQSNEQDDPLNSRDAVDDKLALADRFGLSLGFHNCPQDVYLEIVRGYADHYQLVWDESDALTWAKQRGARSGRTAWQFITELAGRAGKRVGR